MHPVLRRTLRPARRAFSLLEVTAAAALFALVTIGITLAVGSALSSRAGRAIEYRLAGEMDSALVDLSYTSFDKLLADTFTPPSACPDSVFLGTKGTSCLTVADREFTITWSTLFASDSVSSSTEAVDALTIIATTELPDGSSLVRSRRILAPTPGFNGESLLRVQLSGNYAALSGPLFLVDAASPTTLVATAQPTPHGSALFRVAQESCTAAQPCRLALSASNTWSYDGLVALSAASSVGPSAEIVLVPGKVLQVGAEVFTPAKMSVSLYAESDSGSRAPATATNSICVWAAFNDGLADRLLPSCNTSLASSVSFETYPVDPANPSLRAPIPPLSEVRFYVDHPNGTCPNLNQLGARLGAWEQAAVCTSWTWGVPSKVSVGSTDYPLDQLFRLPSGTSSFNLTWSGSLARPAAGYSDRPMWVNPRTYGSCSELVQCTSTLSSAPEDSLCPGSFCLSSRVPSLLAPSTGSVYAKQVSSATTTVDLVVVDEYGDPVDVSLVSEPQSGSLSFDGETLSAGDPITTTDGPGPATVSLVFEESSTIDMVFFKVRLANTVQDGIRDYEVALYRNSRPWLFSASPVSLAQNSSTTVLVELTGTDSSPAAAQSVDVSAPSGLAAPSTATSDSSGKVSFTLSAAAIAPGSYTVEISTGTDRSVSIPVTVTQKASTISFDPPDLAQGSSASLTVSVKDALGDPMLAAPVSFRTATTGFTQGLRTEPSGCFTDSSGTCTVSLVADLAAPAGSHTVTASSGPASSTESFLVSQTPGSLTPLPFSLRQSASASWTLVLNDGSGSPISGETVSVSSLPSGLSVASSSAVSTISGVVSFSFTASSSLPAGPTSVSFQVGSKTFDSSFTTTALPATLVPPSPVSLQRGSAYATTVRVLDGSGSPVAGVSLVFDALSGVSFTPTQSDASGYATVLISTTPTATKGSYTASFSTVSPVIVSSFPLTLTAAPQSIALVGSIPQGGYTSLSVAVLDADSDPVSGAVVALSGLPPSIDVSPRSVTDPSGVALFPVRDLSSTALGSYRAKLTVSLDSSVRLFPAMVSVVSTSSTPTSPSALSAPQVVSNTPTGLTVSYASPVNDGGSPVSSYRVYLNGALASTPAASPVSITALTPGTKYSVAVAACNISGCSPVSASTFAYTLLTPPSSLAASHPDPTSLAVSWSNPDSTATALTLRFKLTASASWSTRILSLGSASYTLRGLSPATSYDVQIGSTNSSGTSWSSTLTSTTS